MEREEQAIGSANKNERVALDMNTVQVKQKERMHREQMNEWKLTGC